MDVKVVDFRFPAIQCLKPRLQSCVLKYISLLNGSFFGGADWGFLIEGVVTCQLSNCTNFPSYLGNYHAVFTPTVNATM